MESEREREKETAQREECRSFPMRLMMDENNNNDDDEIVEVKREKVGGIKR